MNFNSSSVGPLSLPFAAFVFQVIHVVLFKFNRHWLEDRCGSVVGAPSVSWLSAVQSQLLRSFQSL